MFKFFISLIIRFLYFVLNIIEIVEYRNLQLDENDPSKKILQTFNLNSIKLKSDTGDVSASHIHITQPFTSYKMMLQNGYTLECADNHIIFDDKLQEIYVKDLVVGQEVYTDIGISTVIMCEKLKRKISMFDVSIGTPEHRYYTNGILSHNTVSTAIFMLHYAIFNNNKGIMIVANKAKTVIEIMDKIKSIYKHLPFFLKPGIVNWNQRTLVFENGTKIATEARTKEPSIGFAIDILYLDEFAHVPPNIAAKFYRSVVPTVSSIENSKIIITSTPDGFNLFHDIWEGANYAKGHPNKNPYTPMIVYWWQIKGREDPKIYFDRDEMEKYKVSDVSIKKLLKGLGIDTYTKKELINDTETSDVLCVEHKKDVVETALDAIRALVTDKGVPLTKIAKITNWEEEQKALIDIQGEGSFDQEYNLHFLTGSKRLFSNEKFKELQDGIRPFVYQPIEILDKRLSFEYGELTWNIDIVDELSEIKKWHIVISVDIAEGLGKDYSVINIFRLVPKSEKELDRGIKNMYDAFKLQQIGKYHYNKASIKEFSTILYSVIFDVCDPEKTKVVMEINKYGGEVLAELPHMFDDNNEYGSYVFVRYKHRVDSEKTFVGLKISRGSQSTGKNIIVKEYSSRIERNDIEVLDSITLKEMTNFIEHETNYGNIQYKAEIGNDDICMTVVNVSTFFNRPDFKYMVDDAWETISKDIQNDISQRLKDNAHVEGPNYSAVRAARRNSSGEIKKQAPQTQGRWMRKSLP